ncbi:MAG TPA: hypothetical protein PLR19_02925, partial [Thermotogota bacterium]|nr:hypothetical protein [Thermotogota bacterium]
GFARRTQRAQRKKKEGFAQRAQRAQRKMKTRRHAKLKFGVPRSSQKSQNNRQKQEDMPD